MAESGNKEFEVKTLKCPSCGGNLELSNNKCPYCNVGIVFLGKENIELPITPYKIEPLEEDLEWLEKGKGWDYNGGVEQLSKLITSFGSNLDPELKERMEIIINMSKDNNREARVYGATEQTRRKKAEHTFLFNEFMLAWTGHSFNDLAQGKLVLPDLQETKAAV